MSIACRFRYAAIAMQGSYRSWKTWKVISFQYFNIQVWNAWTVTAFSVFQYPGLENLEGHGISVFQYPGLESLEDQNWSWKTRFVC